MLVVWINVNEWGQVEFEFIPFFCEALCVKFLCVDDTEVELPVTKYSLQIFK